MVKFKRGYKGEKLMVNNHLKFRLFEYISYPTDNYELGSVVFKLKDKEIGVVIQTHDDGDFRTDMFGNASPSEVRFATIDEVKKYRPNIFNDLVWGNLRKI